MAAHDAKLAARPSHAPVCSDPMRAYGHVRRSVAPSVNRFTIVSAWVAALSAFWGWEANKFPKWPFEKREQMPCSPQESRDKHEGPEDPPKVVPPPTDTGNLDISTPQTLANSLDRS